MERLDFKATVRQFLSQELLNGNGAVEVQDEDDLLLSGLVDSLGVVRLIAYIEAQLGLRVPPEDVTIENFLTVNAISAYLERLQGETARG